MFENISDEKLQEILKKVIIPGSSIGIHGIRESKNGIDIYKSIISSGLNITNYSFGLVGNIAFINSYKNPETFDIKDITQYFWAFDENNIKYNVIIAIPETFKLSTGTEIYVGNFLKYEDGYGKNDERALSLPINRIKKLPPEFIVGVYTYDLKKYKSNFILNNNYIGLKSFQEQQEFYDNFFEQCECKSLLLKNDERSKIIAELLSNSFYYKKFLEKYESLNKNNQNKINIDIKSLNKYEKIDMLQIYFKITFETQEEQETFIKWLTPILKEFGETSKYYYNRGICVKPEYKENKLYGIIVPEYLALSFIKAIGNKFPSNIKIGDYIYTGDNEQLKSVYDQFVYDELKKNNFRNPSRK